MARRDHELFDAACDVLMAAQRLRAAAERERPDDVLAPTLGCLQAILHELARSCEALSERPLRAPRVGETLESVADSLHRAERGSDRARAQVARG